MPLFNFNLLPVSEAHYSYPPSDPSQRHYCWFWLTTGRYAIEVGDVRIFQYSPEFLRLVLCRPPMTQSDPLADCDDYPVARLWEDLLDILPDILVDISSPAFDLISTVQAQTDWQRSLSWVDGTEDDQKWELYRSATDWLGYRRLDTGYLIGGPQVWFFRFSGQIHVRWDNSKANAGTIPRWLGTSGDRSLPVDLFLAELQLFHDRLMSQMAARIEEIETRNLLPTEQCDTAGLRLDHRERIQALSNAKRIKAHDVDWEQVQAANKRLQKWS
jgi:hypothetical protein